jgi:hypothetical protein
MRDAFDKDGHRQLHFLRFLRSICKFQTKGITANQEAIFKVIKSRAEMKSSFIVETIANASKITIVSSEGDQMDLFDYLK